MKPLDDFLQHINLYAPGCAAPTAYFGIRQAAIEFCERTRLWRFEDDFPTTGDEAERLFSPAGSVIHLIETAWFDDVRLEPKTTEWLDAHCRGWRNAALTGQAAYITQTEPNTLRVVPGQAGTVKVAMFLKPSQDADDVPEFMVDEYRAVIGNGALAYILAIPGQSFTNLELAASFGAAFQQKLDSLAMRGTTGQQRARVRTKASFF